MSEVVPYGGDLHFNPGHLLTTCGLILLVGFVLVAFLTLVPAGPGLVAFLVVAPAAFLVGLFLISHFRASSGIRPVVALRGRQLEPSFNSRSSTL